MKKISVISIITILLSACGTYRSLDLNKLVTGMNKAQVESIAGLPDRILAVNETDDGYQEVLEYRTSRGEIYALEFWNDYLTGYEFMYEDVQYIAPLYPPAILPPYGRPLYTYPGGIYRPGYSPNYRPNNRPPNYQRPNTNDRPNVSNRPNNNSNVTTRPSGNTNSNNSNSNSNSNNRTSTERSNRTTRTN